MSDDDSQHDAKVAATSMLLRSEFGSPEDIHKNAPIQELVGEWIDEVRTCLMAEILPTPGCAVWLREQIAGVDRIGQHWSWIAQPSVMYCSMDCAIAAMYLLKDCLHVCDCCGEHKATLMSIQIDEVVIMICSCEMCAGLPEGYAHLN